VRVLGVSCSSRETYLAVDDDGTILDGLTERLQPSSGLEAGEGLTEFIDSVRRVLREVTPDRVAVLLPETWSATYRQHLDRATLDTLVRVAAALEDVPLEVLARATVRARLNLPRRGPLDSHVGRVGSSVGRYWSAGRGLAALAARAGGVS